MQWYYSDGTNPIGPVDDAKFSELIRAGTVRRDTQVWREGMPGWDRLAVVDPSRIPPVAGPPPIPLNPQACAECGVAFSQDELVNVSGRLVCAACKPAFLQRLREGAPLSAVGASLGVFRQGDRLVVEAGATPPNRCLYCNAPGTWQKRRTFYWQPKWIFAFLPLLIFGLLIFAIVSIVLRKTLAFDVVLCAEHASKRRRNIALGWGLFALAIATVVVGSIVDFNWNVLGWALLAGLVLTVAGLVVGMRAAAVLSPARIGKRTGFFRRAGKDYLATLPEWPGDIV